MNQDESILSFSKSFPDCLNLSFLLTDKDVGAIIGRHGNKIRDIKNASRCSFYFGGEIGQERWLTISGEIEKLPRTVCMVANCLPRESQNPQRDLDEKTEIDKSVFLLLLLPHNTCGAIIGKNGSSVKNIAQESGAKVLVLFEKSRQSDNGGIVKIHGTPDQISIVMSMIIEIIQTIPDTPNKLKADSSSLSLKSIFHSSLLSSFSHKAIITQYIENRVARVIVGKGGLGIMELRKISKAYIQVTNTEEPNESTLVVSGDPSSVAVALHLVELRICSQLSISENRNGDRNNYYNRSSGYRGKNNRNSLLKSSDSSQSGSPYNGVPKNITPPK